MGLDNCLYLRASRRNALESVLPRSFDQNLNTISVTEYGAKMEFLYLRKCWNIRNIVMKECFPEEEDFNNNHRFDDNVDYKPYLFTREKLEKLHEIFDWFIYNPDEWTVSGSSIWEHSLVKPHLLHAQKIITFCLDHQLYEPNAETGILGVEWIDSY